MTAFPHKVYSDGTHLVCRDIDHLHKFAAKIKLNRCWFHPGKSKKFPHYDLGSKFNEFRHRKYLLAIKHGAIESSKQELVYILNNAHTFRTI